MRIKKKTHSLLAELFESPEEYDVSSLESRAQHVLTSAFNFIETIEKSSLTIEKKDELVKRFVLAIRHKDSRKFIRALQSIEEGMK